MTHKTFTGDRFIMLKIKRFLLAAVLAGVLGAGLPITSKADSPVVNDDAPAAHAGMGYELNVRPNGWSYPID